MKSSQAAVRVFSRTFLAQSWGSQAGEGMYVIPSKVLPQIERFTDRLVRRPSCVPKYRLELTGLSCISLFIASKYLYIHAFMSRPRAGRHGASYTTIYHQGRSPCYFVASGSNAGRLHRPVTVFRTIQHAFFSSYEGRVQRPVGLSSLLTKYCRNLRALANIEVHDPTSRRFRSWSTWLDFTRTVRLSYWTKI